MEQSFSAHEATRKRRKWGCACGCLMFIVALFVGAFGLMYYLTRSNKALDPESFLPAKADGFVILRLRPQDEGLWGLLSFNLKRLEKAITPGLPENEQKTVTQALNAAPQLLSRLLQPAVYFYFTYNQEVQHDSIVSVVQLKNLLAWGLFSALAGPSKNPAYDQVDRTSLYHAVPSESETSAPVYGLSRSAFMFGSNEDCVRAVLQPREPGAQATQSMLRVQDYVQQTHIDGEASEPDMAGIFVNENHHFRHLLDKVAVVKGLEGLADQVEPLLRSNRLELVDILAVSFKADVVTADKANIDIVVSTRQLEGARRLGEVVKILTSRAIEQANVQKYFKVQSIKPQGTNVTLSIEVTGLKELTAGPVSGLASLVGSASKAAAAQTGAR